MTILQIHKILTYFDGSHDEPFYILTEDDSALYHALGVLNTSSEIDFFEVNDGDGVQFFTDLGNKLYGYSSRGN